MSTYTEEDFWNDKALEERAELVKKLFIQERRFHDQIKTGKPSLYLPPMKWDGGEDSFGNQIKSIWIGIARLTLREKIDPVAFVRRQFIACAKPPQPGDLIKERAIQRFRARSEEDEEAVKSLLVQQKRLADMEVAVCQELTGCEETTALLSVLSDDSIGLTPLFRYCVATMIKDENFADIAALYRNQAVLDYMRYQEEYDKFWSDWLPKEFLNYARQCFASLIQEHGNA